MNIQIFGTKKCSETRKAERFFKERGIKYQFIDLKEKGMSKGELLSVAQVNGGIDAMINPDAKDSIPEIRKLIREGKISAAEDLANETLAGIPEYQSHYEPLGDLFIIPDGNERIQILGIREHWSGQLNRIEEIPDYKRELDIDNGIHTVSYTKDGVKFLRESFISYPDRVMAVKCQGTPLRIFTERGDQCGKVYKISDNTLCMEGRTGANGVRFCMVIRAVKGNPYIKGRTLHTDGDTELLIASQTDFYCEDYVEDAVRTLDKAEQIGYEALKAAHVEDVGKLMNRCRLSIDCEDKDDVPTDERLKAVNAAMREGFPVRLCFDPMIYFRDWKKCYSDMIEKVSSLSDTENVRDISIGTFRISDQYLKNMRKKYPDSAVAQYPYVNEEGYYQYPDEVRLSMEEHIGKELSEKCPGVPVFDWK